VKYESIFPDGGIDGDSKQYHDFLPTNERRNSKQSGELGRSKNARVFGFSN